MREQRRGREERRGRGERTTVIICTDTRLLLHSVTF